MKLFAILFFPLMAMGSTEIEDAKTSVRSLIKPLLAGASKDRPKGTEKFRVDGCPKEKINWMNVLMMKEKASLNFKFQKNCDIQGKIEPQLFGPFPANLELRNLRSYQRIETQNTITATIDSKPILDLKMREGRLRGNKALVRFEADYQVQINPMNKNPVEKNLGGVLRISEINGKKVQITEKILVE
jgi:hypothetical protein